MDEPILYDLAGQPLHADDITRLRGIAWERTATTPSEVRIAPEWNARLGETFDRVRYASDWPRGFLGVITEITDVWGTFRIKEDPAVPPGEIWLVKKSETGLPEQVYGPKVIGKIVNIGTGEE